MTSRNEYPFPMTVLCVVSTMSLPSPGEESIHFNPFMHMGVCPPPLGTVGDRVPKGRTMSIPAGPGLPALPPVLLSLHPSRPGALLPRLSHCKGQKGGATPSCPSVALGDRTPPDRTPFLSIPHFLDSKSQPIWGDPRGLIVQASLVVQSQVLRPDLANGPYMASGHRSWILPGADSWY